MTTRPIGIDLFAGAGGLSLGFEQAGFDVVAAVELDPIHAAIHEHNFPKCRVLCADITGVTAEQLRETAGLGDRDIDVVFGGPPCQGFSLIGHRVLNDPRNRLVFEFARLVKDLAPKTFVLENVPGMVTGAHTQLLDEVIEFFGKPRFESDAVYAVRKPKVLNAANFGVPQNRRRLIVLGSREGVALPEYPGELTRLRSAKVENSRPECPSVAEAIGDLPNIEEYPELLAGDVLRAAVSPSALYARRLHGLEVDPDDYSHPRIFDAAVLNGCGRARHTELSRQRFAGTEPGTTEPVSRFFRLASEGVCNTLRAGTATDHGAFSAPRPIHPVYARCISVREAARLHSYPDWFGFHATIWHGFRQVGNSVPPLLARAVGSSVIEALGLSGSRVRPEVGEALGESRLRGYNMKQAASHYEVSPDVIPARRRGVMAQA